jgi:hypothetical protein
MHCASSNARVGPARVIARLSSSVAGYTCALQKFCTPQVDTSSDERWCAILSRVPKLVLSNLSAAIFHLCLDTLRFIPLSLRSHLTLAAENLFLKEAAGFVPAAPSQTSPGEGRYSGDPGVAF